MIFTKNELELVHLIFESDMFDNNYIAINVENQTEDIVISIDSNNDASLKITTKDDYLKYQFFTTDCITEIFLLTKDNECYTFKTIWNEEHDNYNVYEFITDIDKEISTLYILCLMNLK